MTGQENVQRDEDKLDIGLAMAVCRFCGETFGNRQAVRAHLKACAAYLGNAPRQGVLPQGTGAVPIQSPVAGADAPTEEFDPVSQMRQQVSAEKLRLTLREIRRAHGELDAREEAKRRAAAEQEFREAQARQAAERAREAARARAAMEAESLRQAEEAKERRKARRRELIQEVKQQVVEHYFPSIRWTAELKAQILQAIEAALVPLLVEELPKAELVQIAEGVRERLAGRAAAAQAAAAALAQKKQALQQFGLDYARAELRETEGLELSERWRIEARIKQELQELTGEESRAEVTTWVDEMLDEEGLGFEDEEAEGE